MSRCQLLDRCDHLLRTLQPLNMAFGLNAVPEVAMMASWVTTHELMKASCIPYSVESSVESLSEDEQNKATEHSGVAIATLCRRVLKHNSTKLTQSKISQTNLKFLSVLSGCHESEGVYSCPWRTEVLNEIRSGDK